MDRNEPVATSYAQAATRELAVGGITFAYRELGPRTQVPVVFFHHLGATLDNWDPRIVDAIAARRRVIAFDNVGVGGTSGSVPPTIEQSAETALLFISGMGYDLIDVFAFSMGGMMAQDLIVANPGLVRRVILAGTGPRGGAGIDRVLRTTYLDLFRATLTGADPKEFLFFNRDTTGKNAAREFVERLRERSEGRDRSIRLTAFQRQLRAIQRYGRAASSNLSTFASSTLIVNGDNDRMVPSSLSNDLHRRIPKSRLIVYPNSGHGAIFQYHEEFSAEAAEFLGT